MGSGLNLHSYSFWAMKILREPLLHFLFLGAVMFGAYQFVADQKFSGNELRQEIVVSEGQIDALKLGFEKVWQRLPTQQEMERLLQGHIREEIMYREALAMGLDRNDSIIRRRLQQKLEFLSEDIANLEVPDGEQLEAFLAANPDRFRRQSTFSFRQIYFNTSERGDQTQTDAELMLNELANHFIDEDRIAQAGDRLRMIQDSFQNAREIEIQRELGSEFVQGLNSLPTGSWQGPIESGFGLHLVYIESYHPGVVPPLNEIREVVVSEWNLKKREQMNEAFYTALRENYIITVETDETSENNETFSSLPIDTAEN